MKPVKISIEEIAGGWVIENQHGKKWFEPDGLKMLKAVCSLVAQNLFYISTDRETLFRLGATGDLLSKSFREIFYGEMTKEGG